jgi:hypothetical protein
VLDQAARPKTSCANQNLVSAVIKNAMGKDMRERAAKWSIHPRSVALTGLLSSILLLSGTACWRTALLNAQTSSQPGALGAISGVIIDGDTHRPISGAIVSLHPPGYEHPIGSQITDSEGRFVFREVPAGGSYSLNASKPGYFDGGYGSSRPLLTVLSASPKLGNLALAEGLWLSDLRITLWRPSSIGGTVLDERGEPIVGAYVRAMTRIMIAGNSRITTGPVAKTDDRGQYRIANLPSGDYVVMLLSSLLPTPSGSAQSEDRARASSFAYPLLYYPASRTVADATPIRIDRAQNRQGIDLQVRPVATSRLSGRIEGPPEAVKGLILRLMPTGNEGQGVGGETATATIGLDGGFTFAKVPAGAYTVMASSAILEFVYPPSENDLRPLVPTSQQFTGFGINWEDQAPGHPAVWHGNTGPVGYSGTATVVMDGRDTKGIIVALTKGVTLSGRIVDEAGGSAIPHYLTAEPAGGNLVLGLPKGQAGPSGEFSLNGLLPGEYYLKASNSRIITKSITWNGRDYTNAPFDARDGNDFTGVIVTTTSKIAKIAGVVRTAQGEPVAGAAVMYFPTNPLEWRRFGLSSPRLGSVPVNTSSAYLIDRLPAGDYYVIAVSDSQRGLWQDPDFLDAAAKVATKIKLEWGETTTQDLRPQEIMVK